MPRVRAIGTDMAAGIKREEHGVAQPRADQLGDGAVVGQRHAEIAGQRAGEPGSVAHRRRARLRPSGCAAPRPFSGVAACPRSCVARSPGNSSVAQKITSDTMNNRPTPNAMRVRIMRITVDSAHPPGCVPKVFPAPRGRREDDGDQAIHQRSTQRNRRGSSSPRLRSGVATLVGDGHDVVVVHRR